MPARTSWRWDVEPEPLSPTDAQRRSDHSPDVRSEGGIPPTAARAACSALGSAATAWGTRWPPLSF